MKAAFGASIATPMSNPRSWSSRISADDDLAGRLRPRVIQIRPSLFSNGVGLNKAYAWKLEVYLNDDLNGHHSVAHEQTATIAVQPPRHRPGDSRPKPPDRIDMELYVCDELQERGLLSKTPKLSWDGSSLRLQLWSDRLGKLVEGSREIAGVQKGEYAVRKDKSDPRNWRRSNMKITRSSMGAAVAAPRSLAGRPIEAPKVHPIRSRGASVHGPEISMPVRGCSEPAVMYLADFLAAGFDLDNPPQCVLKTFKDGRQTVMARPRPGANPTTLKSLLAQAPSHDVWLKDGNQLNLRRSNWELRPRRARADFLQV